MKLKLLLFLLTFSTFNSALSQDTDEKEEYVGKVSAKIYSNFNYGINQENRYGAFELQRAYFGYERQLSEHFFANVKLDVGSPDDISEFSKLRRYAYFKNAGISYENGNITAWAGLFDMQQFKVQEDFWGYRYLYKSYMDEYRIGPSADLGAGIRYHMTDKIETDLIFSNGEGYSSPQRDESIKMGWGLSFRPNEKLTIRTYYAIFIAEVPQMTLSGFAGYDVGNFRLAGEYNYQHNYQFNEDHDRYGFSLYSTYKFSEMWEIFLRYDQVYSNIIGLNDIPWNLPNDGSAIICGIQFTPIKNIHITFDYQDWVEYAGNGAKDQVLYIHLEAKF